MCRRRGAWTGLPARREQRPATPLLPQRAGGAAFHAPDPACRRLMAGRTRHTGVRALAAARSPAYVKGIMLRAIRIFSLALLVLIAGLWGLAWFGRAPGESPGDAFLRRLTGLFGAEMPVPSAGGVRLPQGTALGGPFRLVDQSGRTVTEQDFAGRWMLVYFGYTFCPDVCPTELGVMADALDVLGPEAERVTPVFITIDPERDTPEVLADYVSRFHPRMVGLTGSPEQVAEAARHYRVYFARARSSDHADYLMDHSSFVYLVGPDGRVRSLFRPGTTPESMAATVRAQMVGS